jgi:SAM-dependent methyltransferase
MKISPLETLTPPPHYAVGDSPAPKKSRFWDKVARRYAADPIADMEGYERTLACLQQWLRPTNRALEIGCGTGTTALHVAPLVASYLGTDISAHMVAIAREKLVLHPRPGLQFELADADAPLANGGCYDAVLAFSVLHLVQDLDATTAACAAALAPGGLLISKTPCLAEMNPLIPWVAVPLMRAIGKAPPVHNLNQEFLSAAMKRQGLEILAVERHAGKGRDVRPFIVARKPVLKSA